MATRPMNMFEKLANVAGPIYRYHASQWPRRSAVLRAVWKNELAPPKQAEWPAVKAEWAKLTKAVQSKAYTQLSVREGLVYSAVVLEIVAWFFVGEMIGRRNVVGYLVPADYVSKETKRKAEEEKAKGHPKTPF